MSSLYRVPKPMGKESARKKSKAPFLAAEKTRLLDRCNWTCEGCGARGVDLDRHHVYGREGTGARLGHPWCHLAEMSAALCRGCHDEVTIGINPALGERLRRAALVRFAERFGMERRDLGTSAVDLVGLAREMVRDAEAMGWRERMIGEGRE